MTENAVPRGPDEVPDRLPDHELEELEVDSSMPPRPEEEIADAGAGRQSD